MNKRLVAVAVIATVLVVVGKTSFAQNKPSAWEQVEAAAKNRASKVQQCLIEGSIAVYQSSGIRRMVAVRLKEEKEAPQDRVQPPPIRVVDANSLTGFSWFCEGNRWRLDTQLIYPALGDGFKQISYDGDVYYQYSAEFGFGTISETKSDGLLPARWSAEDLSSFQQDTLFGAGMLAYLKKNHLNGTVPNYRGEEIVKETLCQKFSYEFKDKEASRSVNIWFSPQNQMFMKLEDEFRRNDDDYKSTAFYTVESIRREGDLFIPVQVKTEVYGNMLGKSDWAVTRVFTASKIEINNKDSVSVFRNPFRIATPVVDSLQPSRELAPSGGDLRTLAAQVKKGIPPAFEEKAVTTNGEAPEVVEAQEKLTINR